MSSSSAASTGPWLPVMPIAVLVAPGIGCALYPISSILRQTSRICASVAPAFINTSIERSLSAGFLPDESMQVPGPAQVERVPAGFLGLAARLPDTASSLTRVGILSVSLLKIAADADRPSRLRGRFFLESHFVTKSFQTVNKANLYLTSMLLVEVITTKVFIYLFSQQQMVTDHQDAVANCDERPLFPSPSYQSAVLSRKVFILRMRGSVRCF